MQVTANTDVAYIDVVAGIIYSPDKQRILLALRKPEQHQGNCWEFPGGKQESAESLAEALVRELEEELAICATEFEPFTVVEHRYKDKAVRLHFWSVTQFTGEPTGCEQQQLQWFEVQALAALPFPEANRVVVDALLAS